jgi:hypothetical protein
MDVMPGRVPLSCASSRLALSAAKQETLHHAPGVQSCGECTTLFHRLPDARRDCAVRDCVSEGKHAFRNTAEAHAPHDKLIVATDTSSVLREYRAPYLSVSNEIAQAMRQGAPRLAQQ